MLEGASSSLLLHLCWMWGLKAIERSSPTSSRLEGPVGHLWGPEGKVGATQFPPECLSSLRAVELIS